MFAQLRSLHWWGAVSSILGLAASIFMMLLTDFKLAALISLVLAETIAVAVWSYYHYRRNRCVHPYDREEILQSLRYVFDSPFKMSYEVTEVLLVTKPVMTDVPVTLTWSGRGTMRVRSDLHGDDIAVSFDNQTGELRFTLPLGQPRRFGDVALTHFAVELEDERHKNVPHLAKKVRQPCEYITFEVVLRHRETCPPAKLEWLPMDNPSAFLTATLIQEVPFDAPSQTFRAAIAHPVIGRIYRLVWDADEAL
jgi:hypothetical protein